MNASFRDFDMLNCRVQCTQTHKSSSLLHTENPVFVNEVLEIKPLFAMFMYNLSVLTCENAGLHKQHFLSCSINWGSVLKWPHRGSWKSIWSDGQLSFQGPITDLHSTKLRSLFSCHVYWVEGHSVSCTKWLAPFKGLKRTKLSSLHTHHQNRNEAKRRWVEGWTWKGYKVNLYKHTMYSIAYCACMHTTHCDNLKCEKMISRKSQYFFKDGSTSFFKSKINQFILSYPRNIITWSTISTRNYLVSE